MASASQRQRGRDGIRSTLDADVQALDHAKDTCGLPPAQDAFDSSSALLTTIKVPSLLFRHGEPRAHIYAGQYGQRTGLRGSWTILC